MATKKSAPQKNAASLTETNVRPPSEESGQDTAVMLASLEAVVAQSAGMLAQNAVAHVQRLQVVAEATYLAAIRACESGKPEVGEALTASAKTMVDTAMLQYAQALSYVEETGQVGLKT